MGYKRETGVFSQPKWCRYAVLCAVLVWTMTALRDMPGQTTAPSIQFESTERDAGKVTQGEIIRQIFAFTNSGSGTLEILKVEHS
jgi:hypothetical protein